MTVIGVRELRQHASEWLRRVEAGETIEVRNRGRPVALLTPIPRGSVIDRLAAEGRLKRGRGGDILDHKPLPGTPGVPLASEILERLRADER
ncbi:MAG: type II toxin-antitoxin system Phd/YefM family antitoxin [Actinomycetota bacterium]